MPSMVRVDTSTIASASPTKSIGKRINPQHCYNLHMSKRNKIGLWVLAIALGVGALAVKYRAEIRSRIAEIPIVQSARGKKSSDDQATTYGVTARARLEPMFAAKGLPYPPAHIALVSVKDEMKLSLYATDAGGPYKLVNSYPILGASGHLGPKLREGDYQVPEGIYKIYALEPNTPYHLGLRVNYPNEFDLAKAQAEGRTSPGSDILIHGATGSIGCLAMGDPASEDLFIVAYDCPDKELPLIIAPVDFRKGLKAPVRDDSPLWLDELYANIRSALAKYPTE
jgi:hypothetical protein